MFAGVSVHGPVAASLFPRLDIETDLWDDGLSAACCCSLALPTPKRSTRQSDHSEDGISSLYAGESPAQGTAQSPAIGRLLNLSIVPTPDLCKIAAHIDALGAHLLHPRVVKHSPRGSTP